MSHYDSPDLKNYRSEEDLDLVPHSQSFWDIGNYRKVVKRVEDGARLCNDLIKMCQERAEIEAKYAKQLQQWTKKWEDIVMKGPEYGTLETGWKSASLEGSRLAEIHYDCREKLDELVRKMTDWKHRRYHKSMPSGKLKEVKKAEDGFQKAQKLWTKDLARNNKAKKSYHQASRELEAMNSALTTAEMSSEVPAEQLQKLREKVEKLEREKQRSREKYIERLDELQHQKKHYIEDMKREFDKTQTFELQRQRFTQECLFSLKKAVDLSKDERMACIYQVLEHSLSQTSPEEDLRWYSLHYGVDMQYNWPEYEEYVTEGRVFSNGMANLEANSQTSINSSGSQSASTPPPMIPSYFPQGNDDNDAALSHIYETTDCCKPPAAIVSTLEISEEAEKEDEHAEEGEGEGKGDGKGEEENEQEECEKNGKSVQDNHLFAEGETMRALYSYQAGDEDELTFAEGDEIQVVERCDGGWAKAFLGDEFGYVPESYFELVK